MAAYPIAAEGVSFGTAYTVSSTVPEVPGPPFRLGDHVFGTEDSEWVFVLAGATIAAGDVCYISSLTTWSTSPVSNTQKALRGQPIGVAGAAATSGQYFWLQRKGYNASVNCLTGSVANVLLHTTGTAGRVDDTASAGNSATIEGIYQQATAASNVAACVLNNPFIQVAD